jgi:hypothetical protein
MLGWCVSSFSVNVARLQHSVESQPNLSQFPSFTR